MSGKESEAEKRRGLVIGGTILIGLGGFFLMVQHGWLPFIRHSWPVILIIVGVALFIGALSKSRPQKEDSPQ